MTKLCRKKVLSQVRNYFDLREQQLQCSGISFQLINNLTVCGKKKKRKRDNNEKQSLEIGIEEKL